MEHYGQIVERVVRRDGYSISELARLMNVNRRSVYNWFKQKRLKPEIIHRISTALEYDFSKDCPQLPALTTLSNNADQIATPLTVVPMEDRENDTWKDLYIVLLENYNGLLKNSFEKLAERQEIGTGKYC